MAKFSSTGFRYNFRYVWASFNVKFYSEKKCVTNHWRLCVFHFRHILIISYIIKWIEEIPSHIIATVQVQCACWFSSWLKLIFFIQNEFNYRYAKMNMQYSHNLPWASAQCRAHTILDLHQATRQDFYTFLSCERAILFSSNKFWVSKIKEKFLVMMMVEVVEVVVRYLCYEFFPFHFISFCLSISFTSCKNLSCILYLSSLSTLCKV
jgi:hypothetical protein